MLLLLLMMMLPFLTMTRRVRSFIVRGDEEGDGNGKLRSDVNVYHREVWLNHNVPEHGLRLRDGGDKRRAQVCKASERLRGARVRSQLNRGVVHKNCWVDSEETLERTKVATLILSPAGRLVLPARKRVVQQRISALCALRRVR
jgi:hypothetical protein